VKVLFFAPHSGIWVHAFPEALVGEALKKQGHEIVYVTCGRVLRKHCVVMSAMRVGPNASLTQKNRICGRCEASRNLIRKEFGFSGPDLADLITDDETQQALTCASQLSRESFLSYERDGVPIARYALYEFLLNNKKSTMEFSDGEWREYLGYFESTLLTFFASVRILDKERPDRIVAYNALYSANRIICELAEKRGVPTYFLHAGLNLSNRLQTLLLGRRNPFPYYESMIKAWPRFRDKACPPDIMKSITNHFMVLLAGHSPFGYSAGTVGNIRSIRGQFGVKDSQKLLVATMSSYDERFAAEAVNAARPASGLMFATQVEWIRALLDYVAHREELFLLVRVHPREFPNKREGVKSEHAHLLEKTLSDSLPKNAAVNWPTDGISLYDIAKETDVFLNAWSAVGKEMSLLGIPVVLYAPDLAAYPSDLNYSATTIEGYFDAIARASRNGWSIEHSRMTFRWLAVEYNYGLVYIGDAFAGLEGRSRSKWSRVVRRLLRETPWLPYERQDCRMRPERIAATQDIEEILKNLLPTPCSLQGAGSRALHVPVSDETQALAVELARLSVALGLNESRSGTQLLGIKFGEFFDEASRH
jgi:hypothetical protein